LATFLGIVGRMTLPNEKHPGEHRNQDQNSTDDDVPRGMKRMVFPAGFTLVRLVYFFLVFPFFLMLLVVPLLVVQGFLLEVSIWLIRAPCWEAIPES
jgi:hypothetical protein